MTFKKPELKVTLQRWERAATKSADGEFHLGWHRDQRTAVQWWASQPKYVSPNGFVEGGVSSKSGEVHVVRMALKSNKGVLLPEFIILNARWNQPKSGWGVSFYAASYGTAEGQTQILYHPLGIVDTKQVFDLYPGVSRWRHRATFEMVNYSFQVTLPEAEGDSVSANLSFAALRDWTASAEEFRRGGLDRLDRLEAAIKTQLLDDSALTLTTVTITEGGTHGGDPQRHFEKPTDRSLTDNERQTVLTAGLKEIADRREIFANHSPAMHASLVRAFPVGELAGAE